jgi:SsrA-binding protein
MELKNRKAYYNYAIDEKFTAGLILKGTEVKSLRNGGASLDGAFVSLKNNELFIENMTIQPWAGNIALDHATNRKRKLLLNKSEINKIAKKAQIKGWTIVPLKVFFKGGTWAKLVIALGKGKKNWDKRQDIKKRDEKRQTDKIVKSKFNER